MYHLRKTKTASGATAVQVVEYVQRKLVVAVHVGSAHKPETLANLVASAEAWVEKHGGQKTLFVPKISPAAHSLEKYEYVGVRYAFSYEVLHKLMTRFQFTALGNQLLHDLVVIRIIEPASKRQSLVLLEKYFGIVHRRQAFYEALPKFVLLKDAAEKRAVARAKEEFGFDFALVFYDVTTLYYESFEADELRKPGFSKDAKSQQPQIVLGLMVTADGFPVSYEIFKGNTFEGHTFLPTVKAFKDKHCIKTLTVVADAAMIGADNVQALQASGLTYIVGARMGNISSKLIHEISHTLKGRDSATMRTKTPLGELVTDFSAKRYAKDKRELEKQVTKAENLVSHPAKAKRTKFLKAGSGAGFKMNDELVEKAKLLLGIKGYYTNLGADISDRTIIDHYRSLWHVEQAFRVAKSDLSTRPIFHFKEEAIKVHLLICFIALVVSKYMEIKTGLSIKRNVDALRSVTDAILVHKITQQQTTLRTKIQGEMKTILDKLGLSY